MRNLENSVNPPKMQLWYLLGPIVVLLTLLVIFLKPSVFSLPTGLVAIGGILLCSKWKLKGFFIGLGLLFALAAYHFSFRPIENQYLHLGIIFSLALGFFISALGFEEAEERLNSLQSNSKDNLLQELNNVKITAINESREKGLKISSLERELTQSNEKHEEYVKLNAVNQGIIMQLQEENFQHRNRIRELSQENQKLSVEKEMLQSTVVKLEAETSASQPQQPPQPRLMHPGRRPEYLYEQLKQQFDEKNKVLEETRRELFSTQEELASLKMKISEEKVYNPSEVEKGLEKQLLETIHLLEEQQQEINELNSLLSHLMKG